MRIKIYKNNNNYIIIKIKKINNIQFSSNIHNSGVINKKIRKCIRQFKCCLKRTELMDINYKNIYIYHKLVLNYKHSLEERKYRLLK